MVARRQGMGVNFLVIDGLVREEKDVKFPLSKYVFEE